ncbi:MAG: UDP-2,4-diacetamido-2,4,6-trideoxy-beta-L-altropyranose hydrolase [Candidatus Omnitrophota bacterium]
MKKTHQALSKKKIVIRADGYKRLGMGHLYRNLTLARYLRKYYKKEIIFITRNNGIAKKILKDNSFKTYLLPFNMSRGAETKQLRNILARERPGLIIVDLLHDCLDPSYMKVMRYAAGVRVVAFIDTHQRRAVNADIVFNTSPYHEKEDYRELRDTAYYFSYDYLILPETYLGFRPKRTIKKEVSRIMVCMGGSDHNNLSLGVVKAIDKSPFDFTCDVVMSSGYFSRMEVNRSLQGARHQVNVHYDTDGLYELLSMADIAITAGGNTQAERMCAGVPGMVISQLRHQEQYSDAIAKLGAGLHLGFHKEVTAKDILAALNHLIRDRELRRRMALKGRELVDGKGLKRIADIILRAKQGKGSRRIDSPSGVS